jgi:hypothetical protein
MWEVLMSNRQYGWYLIKISFPSYLANQKFELVVGALSVHTAKAASVEERDRVLDGATTHRFLSLKLPVHVAKIE